MFTERMCSGTSHVMEPQGDYIPDVFTEYRPSAPYHTLLLGIASSAVGVLEGGAKEPPERGCFATNYRLRW